jgi:ABC-type Mn2+/Zn2+ transport system permease subunit
VLSYAYDLAPGGTIVMILAVCFAGAFFLRKVR